MSLPKFISDINKNGVSRDNRFRCQGGAIPKGFEEYIQTASLPGIQFHTALHRNVGHGRKYINNIFYPEITISFYDDEKQSVQSHYNTWVSKIYNAQGHIQYKNTYIKEMSVAKLNRDGSTSITYNLQGVFPTNISEVALNTSSQNTASILTVTFSYDQWVIG